MIPVVTAAEMHSVDSSSTEPVEVLIGRAGAAVAKAAMELLGGAYGKRVVVVAGKGNNGADGRAAGRRLARRGAVVEVLEASSLSAGATLPAADVVIDAAYGTGFRGSYSPPSPGGAPVLAVDIPSGLAADTGLASGDDQRPAPVATATVTFAALKPGLLLGQGPVSCGRVQVADIGLAAGVEKHCSAWLVEDSDVAALLPRRGRNAHKWQAAVQVVSGSPGMTGAPWLVSHSAFRAGAGYVRLGMPGVDLGASRLPPGELVATSLPAQGWEAEVLEDIGRVRALVMGPGLGRSPTTTASVQAVLSQADVPTVLDADGINAIDSLGDLAGLAAAHPRPLVITPHEGEYGRLVGHRPRPDRMADAREVAAQAGVVVLLKGSTTVVAAPDGRVLLVTSGSSRLATAGTGDALAGIIGAFLARGLDAFEAAALAAHTHGRAAALGFVEGLVASDLPDLVATWLSEQSS